MRACVGNLSKNSFCPIIFCRSRFVETHDKHDGKEWALAVHGARVCGGGVGLVRTRAVRVCLCRGMRSVSLRQIIVPPYPPQWTPAAV